MNEETNLLKCEDLSIGYSEKIKSNLSFIITKGEMVILKGKNGSGKSTLIKTIIGEIEPLDGNIKYNISNDEISYLPQINNSESHFSYTIEEILNIYDVSSKYRELFPEELLKKKWVESSGGEKQKTMILTKIKENTKLLILDEPFNHLDTDSVQIIKNLLRTIMISNKIESILLVSHLRVDINKVKVQEISL